MVSNKHPLQPHIDFHVAYIHNWRWYMADLDKSFQELALKVRNVEIEEALDFEAMYEQLSKLRYTQAQLSPLEPIFGANTRIFTKLRLLNKELQSCGEIDQQQGMEFAMTLESLDAKVETLAANAANTISLKSQNTTADMSNHMLRDSASIRVITVVTLVYLPASFVSGFFGMGFFDVGDDGTGWTATPYVWVYFLVAIPVA
ncbi:hypothetical protein BKA56DRAFT_697862 [Ilyonectria sp. MPI-CAGE-AT-0026]|nr:hypothetical protein BKA56DRAFT_697862 [Ilyonectria sp. MPI-CAGE-AT-0026]